MRQVAIVCYDISNDKRRRQVERYLLAHGERIEYSVFEIVIDVARWHHFRQQLTQLIEPQHDKLNYYQLCQWCRSNILCQGSAQLPEQQGFICIC